jgi:hypothetical protein
VQWIFITASFGEAKFHDSANRLITQAKKTGKFAKYVHVNDSNLEEFAPRVSDKYSALLNSKTIGYGFYSWKPEIIFSLMTRNPDFGVMYVDAGCEMNSRTIARIRLSMMLKRTKNGGFFHKLNYPESQYTKRAVLKHFSINEASAQEDQVQATWFMLAGNKGTEIARLWVEHCLFSKELIDDSVDNESEDFIENRYDQSVLSCLLKASGIKPRRHIPCYRPITFGSKLRCYFHPIWSARNRSGESIQ